METPTPEQIQQHINAAFDSVNLINNTITQPTTDQNKDSVKRNYQHLEIMMGKDWFVDALTTQQETDINAAITAGKAYGA